MKIKDNKITLNKEVNELDKFVLDFIKILEKNKIDYVIVSGYVSILFGRARSTEDIDIIVKKIDKPCFFRFLDDLDKSNFWCINIGDRDEMYDEYLCSEVAVRFAYKDEIIPNIEFKFQKTDIEKHALDNAISVYLTDNETDKDKLLISPIELQIGFKRYVLKSDKDIEDAIHLEKVFNIKPDEIKKYKTILEE